MISYANELNVSVEGIKEIREKTKKYSGQMGYSINHCTWAIKVIADGRELGKYRKTGSF